MRFKEFKIVETKLSESGDVYVIGDSHARAMGGQNNLASDGARLSAIARQASQVPEGATVYMTGGHNDVPAGSSPQQIARQVQSIIRSLEGKGCTVNYILFPEGTDNNNQENMAPTRQAINSAVDVARDLDGCSLQGDGIHCSLGSYRGIVSNSPRVSSHSAERGANGLQAGPPYPSEDMDAVRNMQRKLEELGYSVGSTGVDGKYGQRTAAAVRAFKQDFEIAGDGSSMQAADLRELEAAEPVDNPTPSEAEPSTPDTDLGDLASYDNLEQARQVVERFLGQSVNDEDLNYLIRATAAEASPNASERAAVAAVILNRVRHSSYPDSIQGVLTQRNQFQAVTGTRYDPGPHRNFSQMTRSTGAQVIGALIRYLPSMDQTWLNFTSNNPRAYGRGTNINFMYAMRNARDSRVIGQTVFGTA